MKVQVPFDMVIREAFRKEPTPIDFYDAFKRGVYFGVDGVNDQLVATSPTKIPFVSDGEIIQRTDQLHNNSRTERMCFAAGATWIRDKYEAAFAGDVPNVEPTWQPVFGMKCAFWNTGEAYTRTDLWVAYSSDFLTGMKVHKGQNHNHGHYCALIESIDEIGKPPSYFQERGRCTV